jgi:hypothetical protein
VQETFTKENDYTLGQHWSEATDHGDYTVDKVKLSRYFNFLSCQVTTLFREKLTEPGTNDVAGMGALTSQLKIQNFSDIESPNEIRLMHAKLLEQEGKPPPLDEVLKTVSKPAAVLRQP